jgi:hypothetical protein
MADAAAASNKRIKREEEKFYRCRDGDTCTKECEAVTTDRNKCTGDLKICTAGVEECKQKCKDGYPVGALVGLSIAMVLFLLLLIAVLVDYFFLNKLFKRPQSGGE